MVEGPQCKYGQETKIEDPIRKRTKWMFEVTKDSEGAQPQVRRHERPVQLAKGDVDRKAANYTFELCNAIFVGQRNQLKGNERLFSAISGLLTD